MCKRLLILSFLTFAVSMLFSIITIISPNGGETWTPGYPQTITWSWGAGESGNVKIELFRYMTLAATVTSSTPVNTGQFTWTSPLSLTPASTYFIQITSLTNATVHDASDSYFTVGPAPTLTVISPNGGENLNLGGVYPITWTSTNLTGNVNITLLIGTYGNYLTLSPNVSSSTGSYNWTISNSLLPASDNFKIRIYSNSIPTLRDTSDTFFSIIQPIHITSPAGGEEWLTGSTHVLTWTATNITGSALIELYQGSNTTPTSTIVSSTVMTYGNRVWAIPTTLTPATDYKIKISSLSTPTIYDYSASFTISNQVGNQDQIITPFITALESNFPNPFHTDTTIRYSVKETGNLSLAVYDIKGRFIKELLNCKSAAGSFNITWDGTDTSGKPLANGVYYVRLKTDTYKINRKMVLLK